MFSNISRCALALSISLLAVPSFAQDASESHIAKSREAIAATRATDAFDAILIQASGQLKNQLTANNPDQADRIAVIVDEEAIALAPRRGDLELEAARIFAAAFSEEELTEIANFFNTETGKKYLRSTPGLARELGKAARIWANGINRDLATNAQKKLAEGNN